MDENNGRYSPDENKNSMDSIDTNNINESTNNVNTDNSQNAQNSSGRTPYGQPQNNGYYNYNDPNGQYSGQNQGYYNGGQGNYSGQGYQNYQGQNYQTGGYEGYQNGGQNPYGQNPYNQYNYNNPYMGYNNAQSKALATASLVCGILGIVLSYFGFVFPVLFLLPVAAIVLGAIHKSKHLPVGKGTSTAGIVLGIIGVILPIIMIILVIAYLPEIMNVLEETDPGSYSEFYEQYYDKYPEFFSTSSMFFNLK